MKFFLKVLRKVEGIYLKFKNSATSSAMYLHKGKLKIFEKKILG